MQILKTLYNNIPNLSNINLNIIIGECQSAIRPALSTVLRFLPNMKIITSRKVSTTLCIGSIIIFFAYVWHKKNDKLKGFQEKIKGLQREKDALQREKDELQNKTLTYYDKTMRLQSQNTELTAQNAKSTKQNKALQGEKEVLQSQNAKSTAQNKELQIQIKELTVEKKTETETPVEKKTASTDEPETGSTGKKNKTKSPVKS